MSNPVDLLRSIQKIDFEIDALGREVEQTEGEVKEAEDEIKGLTEKSIALKVDIESLEAEKQDIDEKLRVGGEKIERDRERINDVKNDRQLKALNKGIKAAESSKRLHEMELTSIVSKLEEKSKESAEVTDSLEAKEEELKGLCESLEEKKAGNAEAITGKEAEKEATSSDVPKPVLKKYETIRSKRAGVAVVEVRDEACQGCFIQVPPQVYLQLRRGTEEIINCPHCHRMLYFSGEEERSAS